MKASTTTALCAAVLSLLALQVQCFLQPHLQSQWTSVPYHPLSNKNQAFGVDNTYSLQSSHSLPTRLQRQQQQQQTGRLSRHGSTPLKASSLLSATSSPAGAFLILTGIVLVHECGHYLAARGYGIKVDEFSIGFGPKIVGFTALGNEFNFRAFPLGGYVRFPENYNITLVQEQQRQLREDMREQRRQQEIDTAVIESSSSSSSSTSDKTLVYKLANLLTLGSLDQKQKRDQQEKEAQLLKQLELEKKNKGWKNLFGAIKTTKNVKPPPSLPKEIMMIDPEDIEIDYYDDPDLLQNRPWFQRAVVLSGGVIFNLLLAFFIFFGQMTTVGLPQPVFEQGIVVSQNPTKEAACNGILRKGDIVLGVNGTSEPNRTERIKNERSGTYKGPFLFILPPHAFSRTIHS
jgi:membrane-associated protease RseP (regulator of RpoE activity)